MKLIRIIGDDYMKGIKNILVGITIILVVILFHICLDYFLWTDLIAIIGVIFVVNGYLAKDDKKTSDD